MGYLKIIQQDALELLFSAENANQLTIKRLKSRRRVLGLASYLNSFSLRRLALSNKLFCIFAADMVEGSFSRPCLFKDGLLFEIIGAINTG
jgi:hypothetical protein